MPKTMRAARMHVRGEPLTIDQVEVPTPRPTDVLVEVKACGIVPNLGNVLTHFVDWFPHTSLPPLPAIFGLDPTGVVVAKGEQVHGIDIGQRVYVNPARYCGGCRYCRMGRTTSCRLYAFNGYFGFSPESRQMFEDYPYGGLGEYMTAPQYSLVTLPDNVSHEEAARWGYLGTGYRALRRAGVSPADVVLVNGITGTLGLGVALFALALGARKILGTGRDRNLLDRVRAIAPGRIQVHSLGDEVTTGDWARSLTGGEGADIVIDALGPRRTSGVVAGRARRPSPRRPAREHRRGRRRHPGAHARGDGQRQGDLRVGVVHHRRRSGDGRPGRGRDGGSVGVRARGLQAR